MANIEDRVVSMSFESSKFQQGIAGSLESLQKLTDSLKKVGADNGLDNIEKSANKVQFLGIGTAIDKLKAKLGFSKEAADGFSEIEKASDKTQLTGISGAIDKLKGKFNFPEAEQGFSSIEKASGKVTFTGLSSALNSLTTQFSIMEGAAAVALGNIVSRAATAGANVAKSLTFAPVTGGFHEYETQLNAIQTILANTQASGAKLKDVNSALNQLNHYADKTIYNFTEMTRNIGTFTAAGVDLKTATAAIKGIANLAALSGSNSQQASTAMYQLSQAISSGRVNLQDWNSVVNAGMGGTVFQRALAQTAQQMGTLSDNAVELKGKMKNVTIEGHSFRESIMAKPGEQSWLTKEVLLGTLKQFTGDMSDAELAAEGFSKSQIKAIQLQAKTAQDAATKVKTFSALMDTTKEAIGSGWARTWMIVFGNFGEAKTTFTALSNAISGFVGASAKARNSVLSDWKELGGRKLLITGIKDAFEALKAILKPIKDAFREIFPKKTGQDLLDLTKRFKEFTETLKIGPETAENLKRTFKGFFAVLDIGKQIVGGIFSVVKTLFGEIGKGSGGFLEFTGNIGDALVALDNWLKRGDRLKSFFDNLGSVLAVPLKVLGSLGDKLSGLFDGVNGNSLDNLSGSLTNVTTAGKSVGKVISNVAKALYNFSSLVYAAIKPGVDAVVAIFRDFSKTVGKALSQNNFDNVMTILKTSLLGGIFLTIKNALNDGIKLSFGQHFMKSVTGTMDGITGSLKSMQTSVRADAILKIAGAMSLLALSAIALSLVKPEKLATSMAAMAAGFTELLGVMAILGKMSGFLILAPILGTGLILIAGAMVVLSVAVLMLSQLKWESLAKGLVGVGGGLVALSASAGLLAKAGPSLAIAGVGVIAIATGLNILAVAMKVFATMNWEEIAKGLVAVTGSLVAIGAATKLMGPSLILIGPGLLATGVALLAISAAMAIFGSMDLATIGKGVLAIAGSLVAIGLAMSLMPITLPITAAGLVLVGVALSGIAGAIALMGNMKWGTIGKGLVGIGGALAVLAIGLNFMNTTLPGSAALLLAASAFAILTPVLGILGNMKWSTILKGLATLALTLGVLAIAGGLAGPALVVLGIGIAALGLGILAVGKGVELLAKGIVLLSTDGSKGITVLTAAFVAVVAVIPKVIADFVKAIVAVLAELVKLGPQVVASLAKITIMLIDVFIQAVPKIAEAVTALITAILKVLADNAGPIIAAGFRLIQQLLSGIESHIGEIVTTVANIITKFLTALTAKMPQLVTAGSKLLVKFLEGIAKNIGDVIKAGADAIAKFLEGIGNNIGKVLTKGGELAGKFITGVVNGLVKLVNAAAQGIVTFLHALGDSIDKYSGQIATEAGRLGGIIIKAIIKGLVGLPLALLNEMISPFKDAWHAIENFFSSGDPETVGRAISDGVAQGIHAGIPNIMAAGQAAARQALAAARKELGIHSPSVEFHKLGGYAMLGLANGITQNAAGASTASASIAKSVIRVFSDILEIQSPSKVMERIGKFVGTGFVKGLLGSTSDINNAFKELNGKIVDSMKIFRDTIKTEEDKIKQLREGGLTGHDAERIKAAQAIIDQNQKLLDRATAGHIELTKSLTLSKINMKELSISYQEISDKLVKANQTLADAKKTRDDAFSNYTNQYSTLPTIDPDSEDKLATYEQSLANQAAAVRNYQDTLDQLRALGLDDETYQKLLSEGTADQEFANQLLAGGKTAVDGLNALDTQLNNVSKQLASNASHNLYDAGVKAAYGFVKGLRKEKYNLRRVMEEYAQEIIDAIKEKLKIKSPSKVFEEIGKFTALGMVTGLQTTSTKVADAASAVGDDAIDAMRASMTNVSSMLANEIDASPKITPILDLTQVRAEASKLSDLTNVTPISAAASYGQAAAISMAQQIADPAKDSSTGEPAVLKFEQNNYSPTALSETEIYRKTNNQLSQAKSILGIQ